MIPVLVALMLSALSVRAGVTNEMHLDVLSAGGRNYTNAVITRANAAYAVVSCEGGMVQIPMSDMPAAYQAQFGYTPARAAQFLNAENRIQKQRRDADNARRAALAQGGTNRPVRIMAIIDETSNGGIPFCSAQGFAGGILVKNLPDSIRQFLAGYRQLQADIAGCEQQINNLKVPPTPPTNTVSKPHMGKNLMVGNGAGFAWVKPATNNAAAVRRNTEDQLKVLETELARQTANYDRCTTIIAHPSSEFFGQKPIWICVGIPPQ
jgi:hypothetical protein